MIYIVITSIVIEVLFVERVVGPFRHLLTRLGLGYLLMILGVFFLLFPGFEPIRGLTAFLGLMVFTWALHAQDRHAWYVPSPYTLSWTTPDIVRVTRGFRRSFNPLASWAVYSASPIALDLTAKYSNPSVGGGIYVSAIAWVGIEGERLLQWQGTRPLAPYELRSMVWNRMWDLLEVASNSPRSAENLTALAEQMKAEIASVVTQARYTLVSVSCELTTSHFAEKLFSDTETGSVTLDGARVVGS